MFKLSKELVDEIQEVFNVFDESGNKEIDKDEAIAHFKTGFSRLNAIEFFNTVDVNKDGTITWQEFLEFWQAVKQAGHDEEEIKEELNKIKLGESWVGFNDLPEKYKRKAIKHNRAKEDEPNQE